jgi:hypothetical protein
VAAERCPPRGAGVGAMVEHDYCDCCHEGPHDVLLVAGVARGSHINVCASCADLPEFRRAFPRGAAWGLGAEPPVTLETVLGDFEEV